MQLADHLPRLYQNLLPTEFLTQPAREKTADCNNCYMCRPETLKKFAPSTKCCTYYPFIPNYLVGGMLAENASAATLMRELIRGRQWLLPLGVVAPPSYQLKHRHKQPEEFGRNVDLVCPFYKTQSGHCGVWQWRDSQCSTYFCTYDNPDTGPQFWLNTQEFLFQVEMLLAQECMLHKGFDIQELNENLKWVRAPDLTPLPLPYSLAALDWSRFWQHHHDAIELYFIDCYKLVVESPAKFKNDIQELFKKNRSNP